MKRDAVIIGAGFGGLSAAAYLAQSGYDVTVLEQNDQPGGRANVLESDGFRFDMGPSWYLMPDVFERFFAHFGRQPSDYYQLEHLDPHYRIFFKDGDRIDVVPDHEHMQSIFESYETGAGDALERYLDRAGETYEVGMSQFVYVDRGSLRDFISLEVARNARGIGLLGSMEDFVAKYFDHPKLQQAVQYSLVFLGGSPSNTPALYHLMSHVDFSLGVHYPIGGMGAVVDGVVELARELGVEFVYDREVTRITGSRNDFSLRSRNGPAREADIVVSDADYAHTELTLLEPDRRQHDPTYWTNRTYAPSAFLMYLGVKGKIGDIAHHTLVLPNDWDDHFEQIFDEPAWPDDPAYYVCTPTVTEPSLAPDGHHTVVVLVPIAPGLPDDRVIRDRYRDAVLADLAKTTGVDLRNRLEFERIFTVSDFTDRFNATRGTALGLAHTLRQTGPFRPDHRSDAVDGLYYTGAYTRPGIGVPMCLISGEHVADAIWADEESE